MTDQQPRYSPPLRPHARHSRHQPLPDRAGQLIRGHRLLCGSIALAAVILLVIIAGAAAIAAQRDKGGGASDTKCDYIYNYGDVALVYLSVNQSAPCAHAVTLNDLQYAHGTYDGQAAVTQVACTVRNVTVIYASNLDYATPAQVTAGDACQALRSGASPGQATAPAPAAAPSSAPTSVPSPTPTPAPSPTPITQNPDYQTGYEEGITAQGDTPAAASAFCKSVEQSVDGESSTSDPAYLGCMAGALPPLNTSDSSNPAYQQEYQAIEKSGVSQSTINGYGGAIYYCRATVAENGPGYDGCLAALANLGMYQPGP